MVNGYVLLIFMRLIVCLMMLGVSRLVVLILLFVLQMDGYQLVVGVDGVVWVVCVVVNGRIVVSVSWVSVVFILDFCSVLCCGLCECWIVGQVLGVFVEQCVVIVWCECGVGVQLFGQVGVCDEWVVEGDEVGLVGGDCFVGVFGGVCVGIDQYVWVCGVQLLFECDWYQWCVVLVGFCDVQVVDVEFVEQFCGGEIGGFWIVVDVVVQCGQWCEVDVDV